MAASAWTRRIRAHLPLACVVAVALVLRTWALGRNGWGAEYYSAAARSMAAGWHNFLFAAFDPQGFISVDKPPVALWIQAASVRLFGWHPASVLLPQALEGAACVGLLYVIVRPRFGTAAAVIAALALALMPVLVAVNRTNNTDSALLLVLLLAAWAGLRAAERAQRGWWLAAMLLMGVAFNVKMLAAFVVLPPFFVLYALCAPATLRKRAIDLVLGALVVGSISASWALVVESTPPAQRPWVGGSPRNSVLELIVGHNAASRFALPEASSRVRDAAKARAAALPDTPDTLAARRVLPHAPPGPTRLLSGQFAAQAMWLLPFAIVGAVLGFGREPLRTPVSRRRAFVIFWATWAFFCCAVFSFAGGIIHFYYLATLAPAIAVLAAVGLRESWREWREPRGRGTMLVLALIATAAWQMYVHVSALPDGDAVPAVWIRVALVGATTTGVACAIVLALAHRRSPRAERGARVAALAALAAMLVLPSAWSAAAILAPAPGIAPSADVFRLETRAANDDDAPAGMDLDPLVAYLRGQRSGERFLLATTTTRIAAPIIVTTGEAVMAMGGYHGLDGAVTPEVLAQRVRAGDVRFVMLGDAAITSRLLGADAALAPLAAWVRANGRRVEGARWRAPGLPRGLALYDLRPVAAGIHGS
jgi:4-amino-4-deoxy-L-arabinose transferase-like glycosyltransferase